MREVTRQFQQAVATEQARAADPVAGPGDPAAAYTVEDPDGTGDPQVHADSGMVAPALGLSEPQFKALVAADQIPTAEYPYIAPPPGLSEATCEQELRDAWGDEFQARLDLASFAADAYARQPGARGESAAKLLNAWGNHPVAVAWLSRQGARLAMAAMRQNRRHDYHSPIGAKREAAVRHMHWLEQIAGDATDGR